MSCCGSRRVNLNTGLSVSPAGSSPRDSPALPARKLPAFADEHADARTGPHTGSSASAKGRIRSLIFERTGQQVVHVHAAASGLEYHFDTPGLRLTVDPRDWTQMFRVQGLRFVPGA